MRDTDNRQHSGFVFRGCGSNGLFRILELFLYGGSSALLLALVHLYPDYWFLSLVALIPFLWGVLKSSPYEAALIGLLVGLSYAFVAWPNLLWTTTSTFLVKLSILTLVFTAYGFVVNRLKRSIGFNVIFIAALWLPCEYALRQFAGVGGMFVLSTSESSLIIRVASLFGVLLVSFIVVALNALVLILVRHVVQALSPRIKRAFTDVQHLLGRIYSLLLSFFWWKFPDLRAPPPMYD